MGFKDTILVRNARFAEPLPFRGGPNAMSEATSVIERAYGGYDAPDQPLKAYAALVGLYAVAFGAFATAVATKRLRLPSRISVEDALLLGVATHKLSRLIAKDEVTAVVRAPFVRYEGRGDAPGELAEVPRGEGMRKAMGELVTCPDCLAPGVATAGLLGLSVAPKATRFVASIFAVAAVAGWLNAAYDHARKA